MLHRFFKVNILAFFLILISGINAERKLYSNSLVNCMKNNTDIIPDYFNVVFNADDRSIKYDISLTAKIEGKLKAYATVYAFGFDIIHEKIDLCKLNLKQFCPITPSHMEVESIEYISKSYVDKVPGIAYTFPNLDAVARLIITDDEGGLLGCLQASFDNGKTVSHEGAKWATACVAGLCLLISGILSLFGNSASASRLGAAALSLFTYFQSVVIITMVSVDEVPPIANAWAENLAWSMGLIRITFMQKIFRWYVQATGGTPTQYLTPGIKSILTQRSVKKIINTSIFKSISSYILPTIGFGEFDGLDKNSGFYDNYDSDDYNSNGNNVIKSLSVRKDSDENPEYFIPLNHVKSNEYLKVLRGIDRIGYDSNIEPSSIVCTGFTFFILCLYVLIGVFFIYRFINYRLTKSNRKTWINKNLEFRTDWKPTFKGILARYIYIGFPQLLILSLWEFTVDDSGAVITVAVFFLILSLATMGFCCFQVLRYGSKSVREHGNPAAILYGNPEVLNRYSFLYSMLNANRYWFCAVSLGYLFVKCFFVALSQSSGKTQVMAIWILDMFYLGLMCHYLPYLDRFTNVLSVFIQVITTVNSFMFTFFSGIYSQPFDVASVMGLIFFIMNAAVSLILLIAILALALFTILSKNPDARFSPSKDDRTSFQRKHESINDNFDTNELLALGAVAKEHGADWETNMHNLNELNNKSSSAEDQLTDEFKDSESKVFTSDLSRKNSKLGSFVSKLTGGKTLLARGHAANVSLPTPENLVDRSKVDAYSDQNIPSNDIDKSSSNSENDDFSEAHQVVTQDPFTSEPKQNPFDDDLSEAPFGYPRYGSRASALSTNTGAGLSVFGERIDPSEYVKTGVSEDAHNHGIGFQNTYAKNATATASDGEDDEFFDDIDSEVSAHAYRRL